MILTPLQINIRFSIFFFGTQVKFLCNYYLRNLTRVHMNHSSGRNDSHEDGHFQYLKGQKFSMTWSPPYHSGALSGSPCALACCSFSCSCWTEGAIWGDILKQMQRVYYGCPPSAPRPYFLRQCNHGNEILREVTKSLAPSPSPSAFMTVEQTWCRRSKHARSDTQARTASYRIHWYIMRVINVLLKWVIDGWRARWVAGPSAVQTTEMQVSKHKHSWHFSIVMHRRQCQTCNPAWLAHLKAPANIILWVFIDIFEDLFC